MPILEYDSVETITPPLNQWAAHSASSSIQALFAPSQPMPTHQNWVGFRILPPTISVLVGELFHASVGVRQSFPVFIQTDSGDFVATSPITAIFEYGETPQIALSRFLDALAEHFQWLSTKETVASPGILRELNLLREYLSAR